MPFESDIKIVTEALTEFHSESIAKKRKVINQGKLENIIDDLSLEGFVKNGGLTEGALKQFLEKYFRYVTRLHHPNYLGHQCAAPHYGGALGSLINAFANNVSSIYEMGPASVSIEYFLINWMLKKIGWKESPISITDNYDNQDFAGGVFVDGGSMANLTALIIARSISFPEVWKNGNPSNMAILVPSECHYSITKAAGIIGIGANSIYFLDVDDKGAIIPDRISVTYDRLIKDGKIPIALVANACSTAVGIYDPLDEIGDFCIDKKLWFHVDGAHGASALISEKHKGLLNGVEKASSLIWDAHKLLQTPSLCAALLVHDHRHLDRGVQIYQEASYLFHEKNQPGFDFINRTVETTKGGLGEKLFFALGAIGEKGMSKYIDEQYELALQAYVLISNIDEFECPVRPQSNILCFRIVGDDKTQLEIRNRLTIEGNFYLTTVVFRRRRYMRLVFMSGATTIFTVEELLSEIIEIRNELKKSEM